MGEISMSGSMREREAAVIGLCAFHSVLSSLLYRFNHVSHHSLYRELACCIGDGE